MAPLSLIFDAPLTREELRGRRATIVGLGSGRTASGLARFLVDSGARVTISDPQPREALATGIARLGDLADKVELVLGPSSDDQALADPELVFVLPGIRPRSPTILRALQRDIPVLTEIGLFLRLCPAEVVGVTGTKGKSTTTTLVSRILEKGERRVVTGGNIGTAVIQELATLTRGDVVVLELSSFQLETLGTSPHVAVVTNVLEDHLDHHGTREAYVAAKSNIVRWQGARDVAVLNLDDPTALSLHTGASSQLYGYSLSLRPRHGAYLDGDRLVLSDGGKRTDLLAAAELRVPGRHNVSNALAAAIVGGLYGISPDRVADVLRSFEGLPHRLEFIGERAGVWFVNDSQGTTPYATIPALSAYPRTPVVILGGTAKGADFGELGREVAARARGAVLMGQTADEIAAAIEAAKRAKRSDVRVERASSLEEAVAKARAIARPGDVVLLSPACATGAGVAGRVDEFRSYEERGSAFRRLVGAIAE
ncbi:MAG TPA: UDP-N-acetylmuramoyl-L-alanine--D-glutamate ligase [Candidatus Limnocylindria bacterium]|nr:UDP-N-acetylmuramoyl-L-alanine--D-glutamate ligase [Candidatus Limnocylindria bacterium]